MEKLKKFATTLLEILVVVIPVLVTLKELCEKLTAPKEQSDADEHDPYEGETSGEKIVL